jgi:hypothetical protein
MLNELWALLNLLMTKCLSCKMLQSSNSTMHSLSQMSDEYCCKDKSKYNKDIISL